MFDWDTMDTNSKLVMLCLDWSLVKGVDPLSSLTLFILMTIIVFLSHDMPAGICSLEWHN